LRLALHGSHFVVTREPPSTLTRLTSENRPKNSNSGKGHMKLIFTALIALSTVATTFADEGKFSPAWVEGHNYKVVEAQLVDLGPAPTMTPMPWPSPVLLLLLTGPIVGLWLATRSFEQ
jgi:hypothetical protein